LSCLEPGQEIQWARITQATLDEFPNIEDKLKSLMHQLTKHPAAKQAASVQLLQANQDPEHNPLKAFFNWIEQSFGLTRQEQNTQLRKAIEKQKFDWTSNPAIDLQNAISQVHMSLPESNMNEIFRETVKDALKYKLQPYYHLVADTLITALPERLRFIWKNIAVPKPQKNSNHNPNQPIILHAISKNNTHYTPTCKHAEENQKQTSPSKNGLARQIHDIQKQLGSIHQLQTRPESFQTPPQRKLETRTCHRCGTPGHIVRDCRKPSAQPNYRKQGPYPQNNRYQIQQRPNNFHTQTQQRPNRFHTQTQQRPNNFHTQNQQRPNNPRFQQQRNFRNNPRQNYNFERNNKPFTQQQQRSQSRDPQSNFQYQRRSHPNNKLQNRRTDSNNQRPTAQQKKQFLTDTVADYAKRDLTPNLSAAERWSQETKRPAFPYDNAMTEQAFAQHFEISPQKTHVPEYRGESFLEQDRTPTSSPT